MTDELDYGYGSVDDVVAETSGGVRYLKLEYDRTYQLRIASTPRYIIRHWVDNRTKVEQCGGEDCKYCGKGVKAADRVKKDAQWGWIVIDRDDDKVKILRAPNSVARSIKDLATMINKRTGKAVWGDPRTFDIFITKTKENGFTKYAVEGDPDSRKPLTDEEKKLIDDADIDLEAALKGARKSEHLGKYGSEDLETAPDESVNPDSIPDDLGEEKESEDVNPDDIPF